MPLLYVVGATFRGIDIVKFGRTKWDTHNPRVATHERSKDNPFGSVLGEMTDVAAIHTRGRWICRQMETLIRRAVVDLLGVSKNPWNVGESLTGLSPSGEWLGRRAAIACNCESCARERVATVVDDFFEVALRGEAFSFGYGDGWLVPSIRAARDHWACRREFFEWGVAV